MKLVEGELIDELNRLETLAILYSSIDWERYEEIREEIRVIEMELLEVY